MTFINILLERKHQQEGHRSEISHLEIRGLNLAVEQKRVGDTLTDNAPLP